ncbi:hypothetical protein [Streptomyces sp. NPDC056227]|uniref:hypothetical protein n=1 Tax=Streptomyces sp. NPDC056227 TaxID=3345753 RepID=UPI0035DE6845
MLLVPHRTEGMGVEALPEDYQKLIAIVAGRTEPVMAKDAARLGSENTPARVEPVRGQLDKPAELGWLVRTGSGRYPPR